MMSLKVIVYRTNVTRFCWNPSNDSTAVFERLECQMIKCSQTVWGDVYLVIYLIVYFVIYL